ncbi:unnamed protein product [Prunus armeniaca]
MSESSGESFQSEYVVEGVIESRMVGLEEARGGLKQSGRSCWSVANLVAWCSGPRGCASTRDVLLLDAVRLCAGVPARSTVRRDDDEVQVEDGLNVTPVLRSTPNQTIVAERCFGALLRERQSYDYGVSEAITEMVLWRLENQGSYDILMNGFPLQSTTIPNKANKVFEPFECSPELSIYRSPGGTFEADKTYVDSQIGI